MATTGDLRIDDWVVHRPNVVRSVAARVPGIDAEEATSRALEKMVRIVSTGGTIDDPAPYWRRAALNEAISMTREAGRAHPVQDDTLDGLTPPVAGAELDAERHADVTMLRTALSDLADDDRQLLLNRHVHDHTVSDIATDLGVRPHAVTMRLRRAEERLAGAFAAAHAHTVDEPECRTTRAAMHDYLKGRLLPRRQRRLEVHMDACTTCTRAFIDVREVSWMLRDLGQHIIAAALTTGTLSTAAGTSTTSTPGTRPRSFGAKETTIAAGVLAALALGGAAAALIAHHNDPPPIHAIQDTGTAPGADGAGDGSGGTGEGGDGPGGTGGGDDAANAPEETVQDRPPSDPPAAAPPGPATTPRENTSPDSGSAAPVDRDGAAPAPPPAPAPAPAPAPEKTPTAPDPGSGSDPGQGSGPGPIKPEPVPPIEPSPEEPTEPPPGPPDPPPANPGLGTAVGDLLASLGLAGLPGIDLATITLNEIWSLLFGTVANGAGQVVDGAGSVVGD